MLPAIWSSSLSGRVELAALDEGLHLPELCGQRSRISRRNDSGQALPGKADPGDPRRARPMFRMPLSSSIGPWVPRVWTRGSWAREATRLVASGFPAECFVDLAIHRRERDWRDSPAGTARRLSRPPPAVPPAGGPRRGHHRSGTSTGQALGVGASRPRACRTSSNFEAARSTGRVLR